MRDHLTAVARRAEELGRACGGEELARRAKAAGLLHDLGKYRDEFQKLLRGELSKAPHSIYGAAVAYANANATDVSFAVAGHHAGLPDKTVLGDRLREAKPELILLWERAVLDCPELLHCFASGDPLLAQLTGISQLSFEVHCRMLLSCLVDADRSDTAQHAGENPTPPKPLNASELLSRLRNFVASRASTISEGAVKSARQVVLGDCIAATERPGPFFSLTVPTGGGKTLSAMAFALRRAELRPSTRRIIVVIPYLSIIEQNAEVYREALQADVLEHHSAAFGQDDAEDGYEPAYARAARENWDAPLIITTSVRFFETLFSNHPRELRRLHNIANSIVILDEVQTLPREFLDATLSMLRELGERWGVTFVFSTATQPAFETRDEENTDRDPRWPPGTLSEIITDVPVLFQGLKRVETLWRDEPITWETAATELCMAEQALVIVNTRKQAKGLAQSIALRGRDVMHLSTNLCPAHRREILAKIREELGTGRPCLVVSTQLVEAGVDLDFPVVWRALGPLDSIAQAAGRCDREGKLTAQLGRPGGKLVVFCPSDGGMPGGAYKHGATLTEAMLQSGSLEWDSPALIKTYFDRLYAGAGDPKKVQNMRMNLRFQDVADTVKWIDESTYPVLVPYDSKAKGLIEAVRYGGVNLQRFRLAQSYTVNLRHQDFERARSIGSIYEISKGVWACPEGLYDDTWGIEIEGRAGVI